MLTYGFSRGQAGPGAANTAATTCLITGTAISPTIPTILPTSLQWDVPTWSPHSQGEMMADSLCHGGSQPAP